MNSLCKLYLLLIILSAPFISSNLRAENLFPGGSGYIIENKGQVYYDDGTPANDILYYAETPGAILYFRQYGFSVVKVSEPLETGEEPVFKFIREDYEFSGIDEDYQPLTLEESLYKQNYYHPEYPRGIAGVRTYGRLIYKNVSPGVDFVFNNNGSKSIDSYFELNNEAPPEPVRLKTPQNKTVTLLENKLESLKISEIEPKKTPKKNKFSPTNSHETIIDITELDPERSKLPMAFWSTFVGGNLHDRGYHVERNEANEIYVTGNTFSYNFPSSPGVAQEDYNADYDLFLLKMSNDGELLWSTFFGGGESDFSRSLSVDGNGNIVVAGYTWSIDFPLSADPFDSTFNGPDTDGVVVKFANDGTLIWSSYYGGWDEEHFYDVVTNKQNEIFVTGRTKSINFPADRNEFFPTGPFFEDAILMKLDPDGKQIWSTFFGGIDLDNGWGVDMSINGDVILAGHTRSKDFPVTTNQKKKGIDHDAFIALFGNDGNLKWCRIMGGSGHDKFFSCESLDNGDIAAVGETTSNDFEIIAIPFQANNGGGYDAIIATFSGSGQPLWSTYFGGIRDDNARQVATDRESNILVTGQTESQNFPTTKFTYDHQLNGIEDAFALKFDETGQNLFWSTFLGGNAIDRAEGICADDSLNVFVVGDAESEDFPIIGNHVFQKEKDRFADVFIMKLCPTNPVPEIEILGDTSICEGESVILDAGPGFKHYWWSNGATGREISVSKAGEYWVTVADSAGCSNTSDKIFIKVNPNPKVEIITLTGDFQFCEGDSFLLAADSDYAKYEWSTGSDTKFTFVKTPGRVNLKITDKNGCTAETFVDVNMASKPRARIAGPLSVCQFSKGSKYFLTNLAGHKYNWIVNNGTLISGQGTNEILVDWGASGTGKVFVADTNRFGCWDTNTVEVVISDELRPKIISNTGKFGFCPGDSIEISLESDYFRVVWNNRINSKSLFVNEPGIYSVIVSDEAGCQGSGEIEVFHFDPPEIEISGETSICIDTMVHDYFAPGNEKFIYEWSIVGEGEISDVDNLQFSVLWSEPGEKTIKLKITDTTTGCSAEDELNVDIHPLPQLDIQADGRLEFCEGDSTRLIPSGDIISFAWMDDYPGLERVVKQTGIYKIEITNEFGCKAVDSIEVIVHPLPDKPEISDDGEWLESSHAFEYQWHDRDGIIPGETGRRYFPPDTGIFFVEITNEHGCKAISDWYEVNRLSPFAAFSLPDTIFAKTGERIIIPLTMSKSRDLVKKGAESFTAFMSFNPTILLNDSKYSTVLNDGLRKTIAIDVQIADTIGLMEEIGFHSAWGNAPCTDITLDSIVWNTHVYLGAMPFTTFCLLELCEAAGIRLYLDTPPLVAPQFHPSPVNEISRSQITLIEEGYSELYITDQAGRRVKTLYSGNKPGSHSVTLDAGELNSGIYFSILKTPTRIITSKVLVVK